MSEPVTTPENYPPEEIKIKDTYKGQKLHVGMQVVHKDIGLGTITKIEPDNISIRFENEGTFSFVTKALEEINCLDFNVSKADRSHKNQLDESSPEDLFNLATQYYFGEGIEQNYKKAFEILKELASEGDAIAQFNLGLMYDNGQGVKQYDKVAFDWYKKSAEQGKDSDQFKICLL